MKAMTTLQREFQSAARGAIGAGRDAVKVLRSKSTFRLKIDAQHAEDISHMLTTALARLGEVAIALDERIDRDYAEDVEAEDEPTAGSRST